MLKIRILKYYFPNFHFRFSLLRVDLMNEFVIESQISVDDLRRVKRASEFWVSGKKFDLGLEFQNLYPYFGVKSSNLGILLRVILTCLASTKSTSTFAFDQLFIISAVTEILEINEKTSNPPLKVLVMNHSTKHF